jgi:hypothetical protein
MGVGIATADGLTVAIGVFMSSSHKSIFNLLIICVRPSGLSHALLNWLSVNFSLIIFCVNLQSNYH